MSQEFNDQFSSHAKSYAQSRPDYPIELFVYLKELCEEHKLAWDCATGNGQAAKSLAKIFERVIATDASAEQIDQTSKVENIEYKQAAAEDSFLRPASVDLLTVAQALHWFDISAFFANAELVLKPGGVLAVWTYGLPVVSPAVDRVILKLYEEILGPYWPEERRIVEQQYDNIEFPYKLIPTPEFPMSQTWTLAQLNNFFMSWSALRRYMEKHHANPLDSVAASLESAWNEELNSQAQIAWPLLVKIARKPAQKPK